ncbi:MAG: hypothetical protein K8F25_11710 [Fimbriimonadaceae bacterium]|nr:hypothetical protein [Alphaproteobacteria bacterium]
MPGHTNKPREVYFEHRIVGAYHKVSAIDSHTGLEVSITGAAGADQGGLEDMALRKLRLRLEREK